MKTLDELVALREKRKEISAKAAAKLAEVEAKIKSICHHPKESVVEKKFYFDGSYYDTEYTKYWNECAICGAKSEVTTKNHSWYG